MKHQKSRGVERNLMAIHIKCFITHPLECPLYRNCLVKTLLEKNPVGKNSSEGKEEYNFPDIRFIYWLIKTLTGKPSRTKP